MSKSESKEEIAKLRSKLNESRFEEFVDTLINPEDPEATRTNLVSVVSKTIGALLTVEQEYLIDLFKATRDEDVCPGCISNAAADVARVQTIAREFNAYISSPGILGGEECE